MSEKLNALEEALKKQNLSVAQTITTEPIIEEKEEEEKQKQISDYLFETQGAPSQEQIEAWKAEYGEVFVSGFSETELFLFRPLSRPEYVQIQLLAADPKNKLDAYRVEELVCDTCVLWRSVQGQWAAGKAGTPSTLADQIMHNSNFLNAAAASLLVQKL